MTHQPQLIPDQPTPEQAAREAERAEYLERLREKLKDPEFRAIEGFPLGEDEDILALSDPPYYTACPNPFLPEILERWQAERAQLREELGLPDDADDNGDSARPVYHREPFAADVSEGRYAPESLAHSYHTKTPARAIVRYILHYTDPGDVVFDGFCGTGMTGIAAQLCSTSDSKFRAKIDAEMPDVKWGDRKAVLSDLCPAATYIAYNYNKPVEVSVFEREAKRFLRETEDECGWMFKTVHEDGRPGRINYTVWSDVFLCPECGHEIVFWDTAVNLESKEILSAFICPNCGVQIQKTDLEIATETRFDNLLDRTVQQAKRKPVLINYSAGRNRFNKGPSQDDLALLEKVEISQVGFWLPQYKMLFRDGAWGDMYRAGYHTGVTHVHHFYTRRNLLFLAAYRNRMFLDGSRHGVGMTLTATALKLSRMSRFMFDAAGRIQNGVLYIPSLQQEMSPPLLLDVARRYIARFRKAVSLAEDSTLINTGSSTDLHLIPSQSIDYTFVDPPFGGNIMYSEVNFLWEAWLKVFTNDSREAVVNRTQEKGFSEYERLMRECFVEYYRILKPGHWMTVEFHNSQNSVWNAIQEAISNAGFVIADVRTLDKKQGSFKQVTTTGAVKQDLIISAYRPRTRFERRFLEQAGSENGAWDFVRQHLAQLPVVVKQDGVLEVVAERQAYLLYDRMVAFHIQRGFSVPLGAAELYAGLKQRFPERDEMYFLPDQAAEYDRERMRATKVEQLALFVTDEKSAIQWLRRELDPEVGAGPQTYQDLQPKFLRELHQARHEDLPELSDMLAQNFLRDERDRWYVPDPGRQGDLEKLRERSLLREFGEYAQGRGRLRVFRTEAVRAGFRHAWHERDYNLIVKVADRLPPAVLQEDASLLMYYDNALMRAEAQPEQGKLL